MQKNDIIDLTIEDMGIDGEGIGKYEGMTFFVKDAVIGDVIRARVTKMKKNYGYARVEEIVAPSEYRVEPECELHRRCGGCQIQAMDYGKQLEFKQNKVRGNLIRIGGFDADFVDRIMEPIVGMDVPYRYRNKAQFPVGRDKDGKLCVGFYAARTHTIIPVTDCKLGVPENQEILGLVLSYMEENGVESYDETTGKGLVRHVLIRYGFTTKEVMVCLVINGKKLPHQEKLIEKLCKLKGVTSISVNRNLKNTNVILGDETECIWGQSYITDYIHLWKCEDDKFSGTDTAIAYRISPQSFYQVNPVQTEKLYSLALDYAGLTGEETVWDLYCGIGTISLFLAQKAGKVFGVEIVPQAIEDAKNNAKLNGITNAEFFVGKAEEVLPEFYERESRKERADNGGEDGMLHPDVIVVDPPRKGCDEKCLDTMLKMQPKRIVYVSCDSATLARDLRILCDGGYELKRVRACDQFCHSTHVESAVLLQGRSAASAY
ncbi:MAG: 23S rRNA (uracil(1939)-C(5))-methyltransferase RlmD [Roseburia sp.]|nr:23S rRNA (uracil(1939)-C(5))-methyltransferase RlmD [Roseburia sp.]